MPTMVLTGAVWIDINTNFTQNVLPDRIPDSYAIIYSSLVNLFSCEVGQRGRTFQPEYGSLWLRYLQEPLTEVTARAMEMGMLQAVRRWEPRININMANTRITPDHTLPGYKVRLAFTMTGGAGVVHKLEFALKA